MVAYIITLGAAPETLAANCDHCGTWQLVGLARDLCFGRKLFGVFFSGPIFDRKLFDV